MQLVGAIGLSFSLPNSPPPPLRLERAPDRFHLKNPIWHLEGNLWTQTEDMVALTSVNLPTLFSREAFQFGMFH